MSYTIFVEIAGPGNFSPGLGRSRAHAYGVVCRARGRVVISLSGRFAASRLPCPSVRSESFRLTAAAGPGPNLDFLPRASAPAAACRCWGMVVPLLGAADSLRSFVSFRCSVSLTRDSGDSGRSRRGQAARSTRNPAGRCFRPLGPCWLGIIFGRVSWPETPAARRVVPRP